VTSAPDRTLVPAEQPVFLRAGSETLFGIFTPGSRPDLPAVVVLGGGGMTPTTIERNRFFVTLCRRLSATGFATMRFDYHGIGDSTGTAEFRLDRPFVGDLRGVIDWLAARDVSEYLFVGSCFGGRTALTASVELASIRGLVLLAPPLRDYALSEPKTTGWRLLDYVVLATRPRQLLGNEEPLTIRRYARFVRSGVRVIVRRFRDQLPGRGGKASWVSSKFLDPLRSLAARRIPILMLYGTTDAEYRDFEAARVSLLQPMLNGWPTVDVQTIDGQVHAFTRLASQGPTMDAIVDWIQLRTQA
jgi:pimeloyl-ACP methyl ester carboxylesterase